LTSLGSPLGLKQSVAYSIITSSHTAQALSMGSRLPAATSAPAGQYGYICPDSR